MYVYMYMGMYYVYIYLPVLSCYNMLREWFPQGQIHQDGQHYVAYLIYATEREWSHHIGRHLLTYFTYVLMYMYMYLHTFIVYIST